jgi:hypothetical protein
MLPKVQILHHRPTPLEQFLPLSLVHALGLELILGLAEEILHPDVILLGLGTGFDGGEEDGDAREFSGRVQAADVFLGRYAHRRTSSSGG